MTDRGGFGLPAAAAALSGICFWLSTAPHGFWPLALAGCGLLAWSLLKSRSAAQAAALAALSKLCAAPLYSYLGAVTPAVQVFYALNHALIWCPMGIAFHALRRHRGDTAAAASFPFLWTLTDWLAPSLHFLPSALTGLAAPLGDSPLRFLAPFLGFYGVTFIAAMAGAAPVWIRLARSSRGSGAARPLKAAATIAAAALALGLLAHPWKSAREVTAPLRVAAAGLDSAWEEDVGLWDENALLPFERHAEFLDFVRRKLEPLRLACAGGPVDLVVLPEDAIDLTLPNNRSKSAFENWGLENAGPLIEGYREFARATGAALAVGLTTLSAGTQRNSVLYFSPDGNLAGRYDKTALTPASERWPLSALRIPYWKLVDSGKRFVDPDDQYEPGEEPARVFRMGRRAFGTPVCLEGQMPRRALAWLGNGADFLALTSNAGWFSGSPRKYNLQVLSLARMISAAYGLPVVLSGKSAMFGVIDPSGATSVRSDYSDGPGIGISVHELSGGRSPATASRLGEFCLPLCAAGLLFLWLRATR